MNGPDRVRIVFGTVKGAFMTADRPYDVVLFGATGFTGALTAEYLARHADPGTRWALAGRNQAKLAAVRDRLAELDPACAELPLLHADTTDAASIEQIAESARVVITTVGPYVKYGEPLVAACARTGTDYVDLTGEPTFVDRMYVKYHDAAVRSGARIVHACGFDSIPHDLGVYFTVKQLPEGVPLHVEGFLRVRGDASGGTLHSAVGIFGDAAGMVRAERERRKLEEPPAGRSVRISRRRRPVSEAAGRCRCPPSTRRSWSGRPRPSTGTAPTSPTATTSRSSGSPPRRGWRRARAPCSPSPRSPRPAASCCGSARPATGRPRSGAPATGSA